MAQISDPERDSAMERRSDPPPSFASVIDAVDAGIVVMDLRRRILVWNRWIERASGIAASAAIECKLEEVFPTLEASPLLAAVSDALDSGASGVLSHRLHPALLPLCYRDGRPLFHKVTVTPLASNGQAYCLAQVDDVTNATRRESLLRDRQNARYRAVVDSAFDAIVTTNEAGVIQWINGAAERRFQFDSQELVGRHIGIVLANEEDWPTGSARDRSGRRIVETSGRRKNGSALLLEISTAEWPSDGRVFVTGILRDITERKQALETLKRLNEELERKVEERTREREEALEKLFKSQKMESIGQLTGGLAHDFNNLLAAILGNLDLLRARLPDEPKVRRLLDSAILGAERGASLTRRLLAFARRQELRPQAVDIPTLFEGMKELLQRSLGADIQVEFSIPASLPAVRVDASQLELALLNIAMNARDAMPFGGMLSISASAERFGADAPVQEMDAGEYVRISVADSGVGMDETILARAHEPFFTTKGPGRGAGLGLSMIHGLALQSGGALRLSSTLGQGTTVDLWLPKSAYGARPPPPCKAEPPPLQTDRRRFRILVVDDDALVRMGTVGMLEELGNEVIEASSAAEALALLQATAGIDFVVTDQAMPGMRGTELAARIAQMLPSLPVVLATGYAELPEGEGDALPRLSKPFRRHDLVAVIAVIAQRIDSDQGR
jgi:PAS domain S-box-containing protein